MSIEEIQHFCAGTRIRFAVSFISLIALALMVPATLFALSQAGHVAMPLHGTVFLMILVVAALVIALYALRLRQIGRSMAWALLVFVPMANVALPIFLLIENSPEERAGKWAFIIAAGCIAVFIGFAVYNLRNPPGFSRADPTGCYLVDGKPVFQLRNGKVLLPSGAEAGVSYRIETADTGNSVVTDREIGLAKSGDGVMLKPGAAGQRWNVSVDTGSGPAMMMTAGEDLTPIMAVRHDRCS